MLLIEMRYWCFVIVKRNKLLLYVVPIRDGIVVLPYTYSLHISISLFIFVHTSAYILTCLWFAYVEGYKGFQRKFSPLVVSRSLTLHPRSPPHHLLLAPLYSMGMFHATKKRVIVSWSVTLGVAALVAGVKRMPYPWRNIVDAGVVVGLTLGMLSILVGYVVACTKGESPADPSLPENNKQD